MAFFVSQQFINTNSLTKSVSGIGKILYGK
jgi:hypothetical protein